MSTSKRPITKKQREIKRPIVRGDAVAATPAPSKDLGDLTRQELKDLLDSQGVEYASGDNKDTLLKLAEDA